MRLPSAGYSESAKIGARCISQSRQPPVLLSRGKYLTLVNANNRNQQSHPLTSLQFLLSFLQNQGKQREEILASLTEEEVGKLKTLWLIFSSYLEVLTNSTPRLMMLDELAEQINKAHRHCQASPMAGLIYARNAGELLWEVRSQLPLEKWEHWLKTSCNFSEQTATTYMQMAQGWPGLLNQKKSAKTLEGSLLNLPNFEEKLEEVAEQLEDAASQKTELIAEPEAEVMEVETPTVKSDLIEEDTETLIAALNLIAESESASKGIEAETPLFNSELREEVPDVEQPVFQTQSREELSKEKEPTLKPELMIEVLEPLPPPIRVKSRSPKHPLFSKEKIVTVNSIEIKDRVISPSPQREEIKSEVIRFYIPGSVVPKARPRVTANGTFLPQRYRNWRSLAEFEIYRQVSELNLQIELPIKRAEIVCRFLGKHRRNSDLDNLAGSCLDALTLNGAGVLEDDKISCVSKLTVEYEPDAEKTGVLIEIEPLIRG